MQRLCLIYNFPDCTMHGQRDGVLCRVWTGCVFFLTGDAVADVGIDLDKVRFAALALPIVTSAIAATVWAAIAPPSPIDVDVDVVGAFGITGTPRLVVVADGFERLEPTCT